MKIQEELELESLFLQAVEAEACRPAFLEALMAGHVYCVGYTDERAEQDALFHRQLKAESQLFIKSWDDAQFDRIIPFFTSLEKMRLVIDEQESFLCLSTKVFMQMTSGAKLVLNPESPAMKVFYPTEIQALLAGNYLIDPDEHVWDEEIEVLMSAPQPYPYELVEQLQQFLAMQSSVQAAYLAEMFDANRDSDPVLVIGLLLDQQLEHSALQKLHQHLGQVAFESLKNDKRAIDLVHLAFDDEIVDGVEHYLLHDTEPFYLRADEHWIGSVRLFS